MIFKKCQEPHESQETNLLVMFSGGQNRSTEKSYLDHF